MNAKDTSNVSIPGVVVKNLKRHPDDRGFFQEVLRAEDTIFADCNNFKQWSHSKMAKNVVKAWHYHHVQTDWWYLALGEATVALIDNREDSPSYREVNTFELDESSSVVIKIPPGVLHGLRIHSEFAHLFYITSEVYNANDEGRIPWNAQGLPFSWLKPGEEESQFTTSAKDNMCFEPTANLPKYKSDVN